MTESSFQMSQGYDVIPPKPGRAYPILCEEWDHLKGQIREIKTSFGTYHTVGSMLIGTAVTTLTSIFLGAYSVAATNDPKILIIAWAVTITTLITGAAFLYFAKESRSVSDKQAGEVVRQMELIEKRFTQT